MLRIAYLGASGSFTEEAASTWAAREGADGVELVGGAGPEAVVALVARGAARLGVLPVANSRGGLVLSCLTALTTGDCRPCGELVLPVRFTLWTRRPEVAASDLRAVASHPQAFRQCARSLARLLPDRTCLERGDTATAARDLAEGVLAPDVAVLASRRAGESRGLHALATDVQDDPDNRTFFCLFETRLPCPS